MTGGSRGLGAAMASRRGARVIVASRTAPAEPTTGVTWIEADLGSAHGVAALARRVLEDGIGGDILIDNARAGSSASHTLDTPDEAWTNELELSLLAAVRLDRAIVPGRRPT